METGYHVLFVCTGNICRSPFAERLLRFRLDSLLGDDAARIEVSSSGSHALVGEAMMPESLETLHRYGGDGTGFVARALAIEQVEQADLILGLTRQHRTTVATEVPSAVSRIATVREYARLVDDIPPEELPARGVDPVERLRAITNAAFARRGKVSAERPADDDIPDPFGGPMSAYEKAAELIDEALSVPLSLLIG
jgi:protein-tyrosine phosphatase